jgi:hypothetical protein
VAAEALEEEGGVAAVLTVGAVRVADDPPAVAADCERGRLEALVGGDFLLDDLGVAVEPEDVGVGDRLPRISEEKKYKLKGAFRSQTN